MVHVTVLSIQVATSWLLLYAPLYAPAPYCARAAYFSSGVLEIFWIQQHEFAKIINFQKKSCSVEILKKFLGSWTPHPSQITFAPLSIIP